MAANQGHGIIVTNDVSLLLSDYLGYYQRPCAVPGGGGGGAAAAAAAAAAAEGVAERVADRVATDAKCRCETLCKTPLKKVTLFYCFWAFEPNELNSTYF